ncbi:MAG: ABC transporter substrate-binding protein, partial [Candidatus Thorarchaeota archaeon]
VGAGGFGYMTVNGRRLFGILFVVTIVFMISSPAYVSAQIDVPSDLNVGPFIDRLVYKTVESDSLALLSGDIDIIADSISPTSVATFEEDPDIAIHRMPKLGFGHITINCAKYPLNISAFRRAFAFAFDKTRVITDIFHGEGREHDSLIPYGYRWCIEDNLPYHYYTAQTDIGNQILDRAGFDIDPNTGYRLAPDGSYFMVTFEYLPNFIHLGIIPVARDAFNALHINVDFQQNSWPDILSLRNHHTDYDMVMYAYAFHTGDVDHLAYEYGSKYAKASLHNPCNFRNATFDSWIEQLLHNNTYEAVAEAATAMQLILHENVPRIVTYVRNIIQPYRTDTFTGHVPDVARTVSSQWTWRKIHRIDGTRGGTVNVNYGIDPETFNIFLYSTIYSSELLLNLWPSLYSRDPNMDPWPYLAENTLVETHATNSDVAEGNTRFTIDIVKNATWTDGTPITAQDVAFTFTYYYETARLGNPHSIGLGDLVAAYAPSTPYRVILEFGTESYWHFSRLADKKIIPKHIFNPDDGIGYEGWNEWNPVFNPSHPHVTGGPFILTDWQDGEFYELSANPDFFYYPMRDEITTSTSTPSTTPIPILPDLALAIAAGTVGAAAVIFVGGFIIYMKEYIGAKTIS